MNRAAAIAALCLAASWVVTGDAGAHDRSVSYATWTLDESGARVVVRVSRLDLTRLALDPVGSRKDSAVTGRLLADHVQLFAGGRPCAATAAPVQTPASPGWVIFSWTVACDGGGSRRISSTLFHDVAPSHLHFARVVRDGDAALHVLTDASPTWDLGVEAAAGEPVETGFGDFLLLGVEHILSGWDHLAFVVALLLLATTLGEVAALVTSFTVAHSITLGLAVLGVVRPEMGVVEALIGFSIALVAAENVWLLAGRGAAIPVVVVLGMAGVSLAGGGVPRVASVGLAVFAGCHFALLQASERPARLRAAVAFAFGLIHGFGFAGVLARMSLPTERLVPALLGFNLGVEVGQLAVVAVVWPLLHLAALRLGASVDRLLAECLSAGIFGLGLFWFVVRGFGG